MTLALIPLIERGQTIQCGTCQAEAVAVKKNRLPAGWLLLNERHPSGEIIARPVCPQCDAQEIERWNP